MRAGRLRIYSTPAAPREVVGLLRTSVSARGSAPIGFGTGAVPKNLDHPPGRTGTNPAPSVPTLLYSSAAPSGRRGRGSRLSRKPRFVKRDPEELDELMP